MKCGGKFEKGGEKLNSIPVPRMPWRQLDINCITNQPPTDEGYDIIVTAIDYSKWPESTLLDAILESAVGKDKWVSMCRKGASI